MQDKYSKLGIDRRLAVVDLGCSLLKINMGLVIADDCAKLIGRYLMWLSDGYDFDDENDHIGDESYTDHLDDFCMTIEGKSFPDFVMNVLKIYPEFIGELIERYPSSKKIVK